MTAQAGIFALGTPEHCFLEVDLLSGVSSGADLIRDVAGMSGPLSTVGGVNVVVGFRPELWASAAPGDGPVDAASWTEKLRGPDGFVMPATQHDGWIWVAGGDRTAVFDNSRAVVAAIAPVAQVAREITGWHSSRTGT